jgi:histidine triad (HIT) family protein
VAKHQLKDDGESTENKWFDLPADSPRWSGIDLSLAARQPSGSMSKTLFEKIVAREIPASIVYEDDLVVAFRDIKPQAPVHVLIIPKKPIVRIAEAARDDKELLGHLLLKAGEVAQQLGLANSGFRLVFNNGPDAGEAVPHLHCHILGGRAMGWPPG